jgi:hypothetical protein
MSKNSCRKLHCQKGFSYYFLSYKSSGMIAPTSLLGGGRFEFPSEFPIVPTYPRI